MEIIAQKILIDVTKQVISNFVVQNLFPGKKRLETSFLKKDIYNNTLMQTTFTHNPKNSIPKETEIFENFLNQLDWRQLEPVYEKHISELQEKYRDQSKNDSHSLMYSLVKQAFDDARDAYKKILEKIEQNKLKYFVSFRTTNYTLVLQNFLDKKSLFEKRLETFQSLK